MVVVLQVKADDDMGQVGTQTGTIQPCFRFFKIGRSIVYKMHFYFVLFLNWICKVFSLFVLWQLTKIKSDNILSTFIVIQ